jgi:hypothetical protein
MHILAAKRLYGHQRIIMHERVTRNIPLINVSNAIYYLAIQRVLTRPASGALRGLTANSEHIRPLESSRHYIQEYCRSEVIIIP